MVSTRGPKNRYFEKGEKVLCYEPDPTKAKVLYDSKILGTYETKDRRGRKLVQYKVHFQGWSSSWDRKVNADFVLKDTEENRKLQRDLAEKAQLCLGAYLYRKDRSCTNKKGARKSVVSTTSESSTAAANTTEVSPKRRTRASSEDNFSCGSSVEKQKKEVEEEASMKEKGDSDARSLEDSTESQQDEPRLVFHVSERLRQYLEYDRDMIMKYHKRHSLPCRLPALTILENFVKHSAVKVVLTSIQSESIRRRNTPRADKKERDFEKLVTTVSVLKEVADGLRIYFDHTIAHYLLYKTERHYALSYLTPEHLRTFTYVPAADLSLDNIFEQKSEPGKTEDGVNEKSDVSIVTSSTSNAANPIASATSAAAVSSSTMSAANVPSTPVSTCGSLPSTSTVTSAASSTTTSATTITSPTIIVTSPADDEPSTSAAAAWSNESATPPRTDEPQKRKLRSHRSDDAGVDAGVSSRASTSSGASTPLHSNVGGSNMNYIKLLPQMAQSIPSCTKEFLKKLFAWHLLPPNAAATPSMIFGAPHLARLLVKLPEFLQATPMSDEKLKSLLEHLELFTNYLEAQKEWFNEDNYARSSSNKLMMNKIHKTAKYHLHRKQLQKQLQQQNKRSQHLLKQHQQQHLREVVVIIEKIERVGKLGKLAKIERAQKEREKAEREKTQVVGMGDKVEYIELEGKPDLGDKVEVLEIIEEAEIEEKDAVLKKEKQSEDVETVEIIEEVDMGDGLEKIEPIEELDMVEITDKVEPEEEEEDVIVETQEGDEVEVHEIDEMQGIEEVEVKDSHEVEETHELGEGVAMTGPLKMSGTGGDVEVVIVKSGADAESEAGDETEILIRIEKPIEGDEDDAQPATSTSNENDVP